MEFVVDDAGREVELPVYRRITSILHHDAAPAKELTLLYGPRWELQTGNGECMGPEGCCVAKPRTGCGETCPHFVMHYAMGALMHEAARTDLDRLSCIDAVHVIRRRIVAQALCCFG